MQRAAYLDKHYGESSLEVYRTKVVAQFQQLQAAAAAGHCINLWFEDDLFCQVNLWFTLSLLNEMDGKSEIYLVRPPRHTPYGFGILNKEELTVCYKREYLSVSFAHGKLYGKPIVWPNWNSETAKSFEKRYSFISRAVAAHLMFPTSTQEGRPKERLKAIVKELGTTQFGPVFSCSVKLKPFMALVMYMLNGYLMR